MVRRSVLLVLFVVVAILTAVAVVDAGPSAQPAEARPASTPEVVWCSATPIDGCRTPTNVGAPQDTEWAALVQAEADLAAWVQGVNDAEWYAGVQRALDEQAAAEAAARRVTSSRGGRYPSGCTGECIEPSTPCALPSYICSREASSINVWNSQGSGASGKYQFMPGTWGGYEGYEHAADAPEDVQDRKAAEVWNGGAGCAHWNACGR